MSQTAISCGTCRYFAAQLSSISTVRYREGIGECRRHAPRGPLVLAWQHNDHDSGMQQHRPIITPFPLVPVDDWCGEHTPSTVEGAA